MKYKSILAVSVIAVLVAGTFPASAFALKIIELPDAAPIDDIRIIEYGNNRLMVRNLYTTFDQDFNSAFYVSEKGEFSAVADLILKVGPTIRCSGTLLVDKIHVLTAAHCVTDSRGKLNLKNGFADFEGQRINVIKKQTFVHPDWNGDSLDGSDLAILTLESSPAGITGHAIDGDMAGDVGCSENIVDKAGYGRSGWGGDGDVASSGLKRNGQNCYDDTADQLLSVFGLSTTTPNSILHYDFDNGNPAHDAYGIHFDKAHTGLVNPEVNSAPGDSGGPSFNVANEITGVTSYGITFSINGVSTDVDNELNSSFGEVSGDTRVSIFASWIDSVLNAPEPPPDEEDPNPCPPGKERRGLCTP